MSERDSDWLDRIGDTLAQLGWLDDTMRNAIVREVREVLDRDDGSDGPAVTLIHGGRSRSGAEATDVPHDDAMLGEHDDDGHDDDDDDDDLGLFDAVLDGGPRAVDAPRRFTVYERHDADSDPDLGADIRLLTAPPMPVRSRPRRSLGEGQIRLPADSDVWQTLLSGTRAAAYRIHCDHGELHVAVDGDLAVRLEEGQSTDVEGACIRVRACGRGESEGRYLRLA